MRGPAALSSDDSIRLGTLIKFLKRCEESLRNENEPDSALRFELLVDYFTNGFSPKKGLVFESKILGL